MLFAYCNRAAASDVSIITGDIYNGDLTPDNPEYIPPNAPTNINTNVQSPDEFGNNIATNPLQNVNIFSDTFDFNKFNDLYNSDKMYYSPSILENMQYSYTSVYLVAFQDFEINGYISVDVILESLDYTITTKGFLYYEYIGAYESGNNYYYNASTYRCNEIDGSFNDVCYLFVDLPVYPLFTEIGESFYKDGFYISNIIYNGSDLIGNNTDDSRLYLSHVMDIIRPLSQYNVPKDNTVFLSVLNNVGRYNYDFNLIADKYMLLSSVESGGELLETYTDLIDYKFPADVGKFLYTSFQSQSNIININYVAFVNSSFFNAVNNLIGSTDCYYIFDSIKFFIQYGYFSFNFSDVENFKFFNLSYEINDLIYRGGISPFYSTFSFFTLMPSGSTDNFGNISFDNVNAAKYYIEPQDWKDFGAHFNNIIVWLCFEMPLLSNLTKPIYLFLNGFLEIWVQIALPLATALGLIGGALIFYLIYLFISKLLFNKAPD